MEICNETLKEISCAFFRWWYNAPGNNTEQGFDEWWKENKGLYVNDPQEKENMDPWTCDDCGNSVYNCKCRI